MRIFSGLKWPLLGSRTGFNRMSVQHTVLLTGRGSKQSSVETLEVSSFKMNRDGSTEPAQQRLNAVNF